jgi:hypothetical protein
MDRPTSFGDRSSDILHRRKGSHSLCRRQDGDYFRAQLHLQSFLALSKIIFGNLSARQILSFASLSSLPSAISHHQNKKALSSEFWWVCDGVMDAFMCVIAMENGIE